MNNHRRCAINDFSFKFSMENCVFTVNPHSTKSSTRDKVNIILQTILQISHIAIAFISINKVGKKAI